MLVDNGGAPALTLTPLGEGSNAITGQDILGRTYQVQFVTDPQATNWQTRNGSGGGRSGGSEAGEDFAQNSGAGETPP